MKALFQNPKAALAYVGFTMVSVILFVGTEDDPGSLQHTVDTFSHTGRGDGRIERRFGESALGQSDANGAGSTVEELEDQPIVEFATDEDLIDPARGFDPNPPAERPSLSEQDNVRSEDVMGGWRDEG